MKEIKGRSLFGHAGKCNDLNELIDFLSYIIGDEATKATVAFGMVLAANSTEGGVYRDNALEVLNSLTFAKAELDSVQCHSFPTVGVTSDILFSAQKFADELTIPCTEWPTSDEVVDKVLETAKKYVEVKEWKRLIKNENGVVVGMESIR